MDTKKPTLDKTTLETIIAIELDMFLSVKAREGDGNKACQEKPKTFQTMRKITHGVLSEETLKSYLNDLQEAVSQGRNLMTEKYALMENLLPHPEEGREYIDFIAGAEIGWMTDLKERYPKIIQDNIPAFAHYMICEYETYSMETLQHLARDVKKALDKKQNLAALRYAQLFKKIGYSSIAEAHDAM